MRGTLVVALMLAAAPLCAQQRSGTVSPGMTKAQVTAALGAPATAREVGDFTYMFYQNACGRRCGMNDLVIVQKDSGVVDAIFRAPSRKYTGTSSSPAPIPPTIAAKQNPSTGAPMKLKPGPANDTRPSIPVNPEKVQPAPAKKPAADHQ